MTWDTSQFLIGPNFINTACILVFDPEHRSSMTSPRDPILLFDVAPPFPFGSVSKLLPSCSRKNKQITNRNGKDKNDNCIFFWFGFEDVGKRLENVIVLDAESTTDRRRGKLKRAVPGSYDKVMWGLRAIFIFFLICFYFLKPPISRRYIKKL